MGDTGSFGLGGALAGIAVFTKTEFLLVVIGGIFVIEALSVLIQVVAFKTTGKRVFLMAPMHHHFEMMEWTENKIIVRFWITARSSARRGSFSTTSTSARTGERPLHRGRAAALGTGGVRGDRPGVAAGGGDRDRRSADDVDRGRIAAAGAEYVAGVMPCRLWGPERW